MAYVINGGERPTSRFQLFVDLCCQAYNLIRKHSGLFLNLLSLVRQDTRKQYTLICMDTWTISYLHSVTCRMCLHFFLPTACFSLSLFSVDLTSFLSHTLAKLFSFAPAWARIRRFANHEVFCFPNKSTCFTVVLEMSVYRACCSIWPLVVSQLYFQRGKCIYITF